MVCRCLIVASGPIDGEALDRAVNDCIGRDCWLFHALVPTDQVKLETTAWAEGGWMPAQARAAMDAAWQEAVCRRGAKLEQARSRAEHRLSLLIARIHALGGEATGEVVAEKPFEATRAALERLPPLNRIIVSTLPSSLSRWAKMDLPNRIARATDIPVALLDAPS